MILAYCKFCKRKTIIFDKMPVRPTNRNNTETKKVCFECQNELK